MLRNRGHMQTQSASYLSSLESNANIFWNELSPKESSCAQIKKLLEIYATYERWEDVIQLASKAILHLDHDAQKVEFYHMWICALNEIQDFSSLVILGQHLRKMSLQCVEFYSLAVMAYTFSGKNKISLTLLKKEKNILSIKTKYHQEALALFLCSLNNKKYSKKGIILCKKICFKKGSSYLTMRNCLRVFSQFNCEEEMSQAYNSMNIRFPFAHEPYIVAALIAMEERNWIESIRLLKQIIADNIENKQAILALSHSYNQNGEVEKAYELLVEKKGIFHEFDYDYNYAMNEILARKNKLNRVLENFLQKNDQPSIASIVLFKGIRQTLRVSPK